MVSRQVRVGGLVWPVASCRARTIIGRWITVIAVTAATGCVNVNAVLERLSEARRLVSDIRAIHQRS
jgi:hypothetical protein